MQKGMLVLMLAASAAVLSVGCGSERQASRPSADGAARGVTAGMLHDGTELTIGQGTAEGKALVLVYFATW